MRSAVSAAYGINVLMGRSIFTLTSLFDIYHRVILLILYKRFRELRHEVKSQLKINLIC